MIIQFLSNPWISLIAWIIGIVSGFLQIKSFLDDRKYANANKEILEQAQRNWEGKFTQEQIDSMKQELKRLEESINRDVPQKARRIFLEDQLSTLEDDLARNYLRYSNLTNQLGEKEENLPDHVYRAIENVIMPSYLERQRQQKSILLISGIIITLFFFVNLRQIFLGYTFSVDGLSYNKGAPYPFGWILLFILGTLCFAFVEYFLFQKIIKSLVSKLNRSIFLSSFFSAFSLMGILGTFSLWIFATKIDRFVYEYVEKNGVPGILVPVLAATTFIAGFFVLFIFSSFMTQTKK